LALRREVPRFLNSPGRFEAWFGDRELDLADVNSGSTDTSWLAAAKGVALTDWFEGARTGIKVQALESWLRSAQAWGENVAAHESRTFEPTLRFPMAMRVSTEPQVAGWIRWLESRMDLKRRFLSLIVSGDADDTVGSLTVIAREVLPEDFLLLTPLAGTVRYLDDLSATEAGAAGTGAEVDSPSGPPAVGSPETWEDFVCAPVTVT
jgi:hypothetical protein